MTIVLVHGNPETAAIWDELRQHLNGEVVALSPPGFGAPVPDGFGATSDDYLRWLESELAQVQGPIDLVGHDWGGGHVARLACSRPELIRSWTIDIAGCFDPEYVWHDFAQVWQKPGDGEEAIRQMVATPLEARVAQFEGLGMSVQAAREVAAAGNEAMGRCILALYRSAAQPAMAEWGKALPSAAARPGLVIIPTEDHFTGGEALARRSAERAGAKVGVLQGLGHWWMCEDPKRGAAVINDFIKGLA
ncbi:MAG: alpha/beta fold hydrolase [Tepidiformaceae bacterium]